jgi:phosphonatase-like hydrolase
MTIGLVVFDMAGTTIYDNDAVNVCLRRALASVGVTVGRDAANRVMGEAKPVAIAKLLRHSGRAHVPPSHPEVLAIHDNFQAIMLTHYRTDPSVRQADGAISVFRELKDRGVRVALDTGFSRVIADAVLGRLGWLGAEFIDATVTSDEVERGRPHPDLITRAMSLTGVDVAAAVAKVGDTPADLLEGTAAGCSRVIGITTGSHSREQLAHYPHTHLTERLTDVPAICGLSR